jgi:hypothetical protein
MIRIELELIRVMFISGDTAGFWVLKGLAKGLKQDFKFLEAYGTNYDEKSQDNVIDKTRSFSIRMDSIAFIEYKNKIKTTKIENEE